MFFQEVANLEASQQIDPDQDQDHSNCRIYWWHVPI